MKLRIHSVYVQEVEHSFVVVDTFVVCCCDSIIDLCTFLQVTRFFLLSANKEPTNIILWFISVRGCHIRRLSRPLPWRLLFQRGWFRCDWTHFGHSWTVYVRSSPLFLQKQRCQHKRNRNLLLLFSIFIVPSRFMTFHPFSFHCCITIKTTPIFSINTPRFSIDATVKYLIRPE